MFPGIHLSKLEMTQQPKLLPIYIQCLHLRAGYSRMPVCENMLGLRYMLTCYMLTCYMYIALSVPVQPHHLICHICPPGTVHFPPSLLWVLHVLSPTSGQPICRKHFKITLSSGWKLDEEGGFIRCEQLLTPVANTHLQ